METREGVVVVGPSIKGSCYQKTETTFLPSTGQEINIAQPKKTNYFASHLIFHRFSPFNCCLSVVL